MSSSIEIALILAAVAVVVVLAVLVLRKKPPELPRDAQTKTPQLAKDAPGTAKKAALEKSDVQTTPLAPGSPKGVSPAALESLRPELAAEIVGEEALKIAPPPPPPAKPSAEELATLKKGLASARGGFVAKLARLFSGKREIDPELLGEIEEVLISADVGVKTTERILNRLRDRMNKRELTDERRVWAAIREEAEDILNVSKQGLAINRKPAVILVVGVNGVGKTTTTGKLASRFAHHGKRVVLAAADTFRAAAVLQLDVWGRRAGCPVVKGKEGADPGSVVFDAIKRAESEGADLVIVDTAGRLHTKVPLMEELKKVGRTVEKALGRPADEVLLVLDATNGQNAREQAALFREAMSISGIVLTKLDGTAKGGVVLGIVDEHKVPIRFIGIGERVEDLRECETSSFIDALFDRTDSESSAA
jgi:fused signal recognition particle receptor